MAYRSEAERWADERKRVAARQTRQGDTIAHPAIALIVLAGFVAVVCAWANLIGARP